MHERYRGRPVRAELSCQRAVTGELRASPPARRIGMLAVVTAVLLLISALVLFFQVRGFLSLLETRMAAEAGGDTRLRAIGHQMEALQVKFHALLADSVEMRLKALERSVETGNVSADELRTFEELQKDLALLESYGASSGSVSLDGSLEHSRFRAVPQGRGPGRNRDLANEILGLKTLLYFFLAGLAASGAVLAGYVWIQHRRNHRRIDAALERLPLLARSPSEEGH